MVYEKHTYCPLRSGRCNGDCELFGAGQAGCALKTLALHTSYMAHVNDPEGDGEDWEPNPNLCWYNAEEDGLVLDEAKVGDDYFYITAFNIGAIPPLLERIAKALEAIADK